MMPYQIGDLILCVFVIELLPDPVVNELVVLALVF
jgi:hypothetical protein